MKRFFLSFLLALMAGGLFAQNEQCDFYIQSSFDSECVMTVYGREKPELEHEQTECLLACAGSTVSYKVMGAPAGYTYAWDVAGSGNYTVSSGGSIVTVDWPDALTIGQLILTATSADDYVCLKKSLCGVN